MGVLYLISKKMLRLVENGSAIRAMFEEGNRLAALYGPENVYDFSLGNPNFPAPKALAAAAEEILENSDSVAIHGYMSNAGYEDVRATVAESLNRRFGTDFTSANILMTVGAAGGMNVLLKTILDPGDEVDVFAPYFVEYGNYVANFDGVIKVVPPCVEDFHLNVEGLADIITPRTKAVIINSPNNPTGMIYPRSAIEALAKVLEDKQREFGTSIYLISDEPYRELAYDGAEVPFVTRYYKNAIVAYSWSKSMSIPGERIGYLAIPSSADDFEKLTAAAAVANRVLGFVNAPSLFQKIVAKCIDEKADIDAYDKNRKRLYTALTEMGFECVKPQGAFYFWVKMLGDSESEFVAAAKKYNLLLVPGSSFACPGYVRIAYCVSPDMIERSLPAFEKLANEYRSKSK